MKKNFVVLGVGNSGTQFPLAMSRHQCRAIGYANMLNRDTSVKSCSEFEVLEYMEKYYVLNLD